VHADGVTPLEEIQCYLPEAILLALFDFTRFKEDEPEFGIKKGQRVRGSKRPRGRHGDGNDWQTISFPETQTPSYQAELKRHLGTGVLLGAASGGICAIDGDSPERVQKILALAPWLADTLRINGRPGREQFFVQIVGEYPPTKEDHGLDLEWRADGVQSVVRGIHPLTGQPYRIVHGAVPLQIEFHRLSGVLADLFGPDEEDGAGTGAKEDASWTRDYAGINFDELDLVRCLRSVGFTLKQSEKDPEMFYIRSPWIGQHTPPNAEKDTVIIQGKEGWPIFKCLHANHCGGRRLKDILELIKAREPEIDFKQFLTRGVKKERTQGWFEAIDQGTATGADFMTIKTKTRKKLLDNWFCEGDTGFIYSARGTGKTWLAYGMALAISKGEKFGPWARGDEAAGVVYVDGEMPAELMQERHAALGPPGEKFWILNHEILFDRTERVLNIAEPAVQKAILEFCLKKEARVLFLDNLSALASGVAESDADDWEKLLGWLLDLRRRHIAVVIVHHAGRSGQMEALLGGRIRFSGLSNWKQTKSLAKRPVVASFNASRKIAMRLLTRPAMSGPSNLRLNCLIRA
jgi:hypothetical protein